MSVRGCWNARILRSVNPNLSIVSQDPRIRGRVGPSAEVLFPRIRVQSVSHSVSSRCAIGAALAAALLPAALTAASPAQAQFAQSPIWTGAYAGIHGGMNWSDVDWSGGSSFDSQAATYGGHLGINLGLGIAVVGVEADLSVENAEYRLSAGVGGVTYGADAKASGTLRGRVGVPIGPALLYATAGYAWTNFDISYRDATGSAVERSSGFHGIVYGIGVEAMVLPKITVRLEALEYDYSRSTIDLGSLGTSRDTFDPSSTVVRAGVSFQFN